MEKMNAMIKNVDKWIKYTNKYWSSEGSPHFQENLAEFRSYFHQGVKVAGVRRRAESVKVVFFKFLLLPSVPRMAKKWKLKRHTDSDFT